MPDPIEWGLALPYYSAALAFGYLLGSIPFGLLLTRIAGLGDVTLDIEGSPYSKNIGN